MKTYFFVATIGALALSSCVSKVMILQSPIVSMKASDSGAATVLKGGKTVDEKWCSDETPAHPNDDGSKHYGMIDQVIWKAHQSTNSMFFKDAKFYQQGTCVLMSAEAVDAVAEGASQPSGAAPAGKAKSKS